MRKRQKLKKNDNGMQAVLAPQWLGWMSESSFLMEKRWLNQKAFRSTNYFTTHDPSKEVVSRGCLKIGTKQWGIWSTYLLYSHTHVHSGSWFWVCSFMGGTGSHPSGRSWRGLGDSLRTYILVVLIEPKEPNSFSKITKLLHQKLLPLIPFIK